MPKIVVFTAHRDVITEHSSLITEQTKIFCSDADHFIVGGARGGDTIGLSAVCDLIETGKRLPVTVVVPATLDKQPAEARQVVSRALLLGGSLIEMGLPYNASTLKLRNQRMVDLAWELGECTLLAYWRNIYKSGTYSTINYYWKSGPKDAKRFIQYIKL